MLQDMPMLTTSKAQVGSAKDSGTVLIVEDDPRMQKVLQRIFLEEG